MEAEQEGAKTVVENRSTIRPILARRQMPREWPWDERVNGLPANRVMSEVAIVFETHPRPRLVAEHVLLDNSSLF